MSSVAAEARFWNASAPYNIDLLSREGLTPREGQENLVAAQFT